MTKYEVGIEYGPTAADVHYIIVEAESTEDALLQGRQWANHNRMITAMIVTVNELVSDDDYTDILEWTPEEEEAFLHILDNSGDDNGTI
jgi:hypothetical protein